MGCVRRRGFGSAPPDGRVTRKAGRASPALDLAAGGSSAVATVAGEARRADCRCGPPGLGSRFAGAGGARPLRLIALRNTIKGGTAADA